ncbi:hypothetical protein GINT2_001747 [Glugoides intestinalis]
MRILHLPILMFYLLESPVGIALIKKDNDSTSVLVEKLLFTLNDVSTAAALCKNMIPDNVIAFLKNNCPVASTLNVLNPKLVEKLNLIEELGLNVVSLPDEEFRRLRTNPFKLFDVSKDVFNLVTYNVAQSLIETHGSDLIVIDMLTSIEELEESINNSIMRVRDWYSIHFPELNTVSDHITYLNYLMAIGNRIEFLSTETTGPEGLGVPDDIVYMARNSMGSEITQEDIQKIKDSVKGILSDIKYKNSRSVVLKGKVQEDFPNLYALIGEVLTAKLLRKAGSMSQLSLLPSSTIQILGAEKAFNEAVKSKTNTPKYGFIFDSSFVSGRSEEIRGKAARILANKISLCSRVDSDPKNSIKDGSFGVEQKEKVEKQIERQQEAVSVKKGIVTQKKRIISVKEYNLSKDCIKKAKTTPK